jgi:hypothetical protein
VGRPPPRCGLAKGDATVGITGGLRLIQMPLCIHFSRSPISVDKDPTAKALCDHQTPGGGDEVEVEVEVEGEGSPTCYRWWATSPAKRMLFSTIG